MFKISIQQVITIVVHCLMFFNIHRVFSSQMFPQTCLPGSHIRLDDRFPISLEAVHAGEACWAVF